MTQYDVIVVGSGIVGASAAILLAKNTRLQIAVLDVQPRFRDWDPAEIDYRVSAISPESQRFLQTLNVWPKIAAKRVSPYGRMWVWDAAGRGKIEFDCGDVDAENLGYIIEDSVIRSSLRETFSEHGHLHFLHPIQLSSLHEESDCITLRTQEEKVFSASLVIAADGAHSWVREQAGLQLRKWDYQQTAIVATVRTEHPHAGIARQRFLATGPLAFLPLAESHTSSIVWSTSPEQANLLVAEDEVIFCQSLTKAFAGELGNILETSSRHYFPLAMRHAKNYVKPRIALVGDAAHTIHPLAGQGVNLGLLDAACLGKVVLNALDINRDYSSLATLRRYERERKSDNLIMLSAVEGLKQVFQSEKKTMTAFRNWGLDFANQLPALKKFFINYALGRRTI